MKSNSIIIGAFIIIGTAILYFEKGDSPISNKE